MHFDRIAPYDDWMETAAAGRLMQQARTQWWLAVDFAVPSGRRPGLRAGAIHAAPYAVFRRIAALPAHRSTPPDGLLRTAGFSLVRRRESSRRLLQADLRQRTA